jgi:hypothetical protein
VPRRCPAFDPTLQPATFNICAPEYFEQLILPRLLKRFDFDDLPVMVNMHKFETDIPPRNCAMAASIW